MASFGQQNQPIKATPVGYIDSAFIDGNDGSNIVPTWNAPPFTLQNLQVGTTFSIDVSTAFLTDPGNPASQLGFLAVSGIDPVTAGFSFNGYVLSNPCTVAASGSFQLVAVRGAVSVLSPVLSYSINAPAGVDNIAPTVPTGIAVTPGTVADTIALAFDAPCDVASSTAPASGTAHVDVLVNGAVASPPSPIVTPANALPYPTSVNVGGITNPTAPSFFQSGTAWTVSCAGTGIANTATEQCLLIDFGLFSGAQKFIAKLDSYTSSAANALAGVMLHETAAQGGRFLGIGLGPSGGTTGLFVYSRTATSGASALVASQLKDQNGQPITGPVYVKIARAADNQTLTVFYSLNGLGWTLITTQTVAMNAAVHYVVFDTSQSAGVDATASIEEVAISSGATVSATITASAPVPIQLRSTDNAANVSALSATIQGVPLITSPAGKISWNPGHRILPGSGTDGSRNTPNLANAKAAMDKVCGPGGWDIHNQVVAFHFPMHWAQLENALGDYSGNWDSSGNSGDNLIGGLVQHAQSYNPPRTVGFYLNCTGNGEGGGVINGGFPTFFAPPYLNSSTYAGGVEWAGRPGYTTTTVTYKGINACFWNINVAMRIVSLVQHFYNKFGPDSSTPGLDYIDLFSEISMGPQGGLELATNEEFYATLKTMLPAIRAAAPKLLMSIKESFGMPGSTSVLPQIAQVMFQSMICMAGEDDTNKIYLPNAHLNQNQQNAAFSSGAKIYKGVYPGATVDHSVARDWMYVCNAEINEYGQTGNGQQTNPVPPAKSGSGYIYNDPNYPGIMNGAYTMQTGIMIWHVDQGEFGPNINNTTYYSTAPNNPTPGPGAGSNAARPHLGDVITGNTSYPGISGPLPIPNMAYPVGWP